MSSLYLYILQTDITLLQKQLQAWMENAIYIMSIVQVVKMVA